MRHAISNENRQKIETVLSIGNRNAQYIFIGIKEDSLCYYDVHFEKTKGAQRYLRSKIIECYQKTYIDQEEDDFFRKLAEINFDYAKSKAINECVGLLGYSAKMSDMDYLQYIAEMRDAIKCLNKPMIVSCDELAKHGNNLSSVWTGKFKTIPDKSLIAVCSVFCEQIFCYSEKNKGWFEIYRSRMPDRFEDVKSELKPYVIVYDHVSALYYRVISELFAYSLIYVARRGTPILKYLDSYQVKDRDLSRTLRRAVFVTRYEDRGRKRKICDSYETYSDISDQMRSLYNEFYKDIPGNQIPCSVKCSALIPADLRTLLRIFNVYKTMETIEMIFISKVIDKSIVLETLRQFLLTGGSHII